MTWKLYIPNDKSEDGWVVDEAGDFVAVGLKPNRRENARLIAAAPDLLAALTKLVATWDANHIPSALDDLSPPNLSIEAARAAINKAKGTDQ